MAIPCFAMAQSNLVTTNPENRSALIEHFTGINGGEGGIGYNALSAEYQTDPARTSVICYHAGGTATPVAGQPDFQTADGDAINFYFSILQHPRGIVGRVRYQNQFMVHFDDYDVTAGLIRNQSSPVNLGMQTSWDPATRNLSVDVEVYYTATGTGGNDYINVVLVENDVIGFQADFFNGDDTAYAHPWLYREKLTVDVWGDEVTNNSMGHNETRTYTLNGVSSDYNIDNCWVVAYIGELQEDVYQAKHVAASGGSTQVGIEENELEQVLGFAYPSPANESMTIPLRNLKEDASIRVSDSMGKLVFEQYLPKGSASVNLDVSGWASGLYSYSLISETGKSTAGRTVQVQ